MKQCTKCLETKPFDRFTKRGNGYVSHCKDCRAERYKEYSKTEVEKERLRKRTVEKREAAQQFVRGEKSRPCADCGVSYPYYVMQFDHLGGKDWNIGRLVSIGATSAKIALEIAKCELVCANCHAERTHQRRLDKA